MIGTGRRWYRRGGRGRRSSSKVLRDHFHRHPHPNREEHLERGDSSAAEQHRLANG